MDAEEALRLLVEAAMDGDARELMEHAENLADWLECGGAPPRGARVGRG